MSEENLNQQTNYSNFVRNKFGLFDHIQYVYNETGEIDWVKMVEEKYLFPNKDWFKIRSLPIPKSIEGLFDNQLLIKLMGLKKLLKLRGYSSITYRFGESYQDYTRMICQIVWEPNFETDNKVIITESAANASITNVDPFVSKFTETICENRALARNIRSFLGIDICSQEEIDSSKDKKVEESSQEVTLPTSQGLLEKSAKSIGINNFEEFANYLVKLSGAGTFFCETQGEWSKYSDIPAKEARILIGIIKTGQLKP